MSCERLRAACLSLLSQSCSSSRPVSVRGRFGGGQAQKSGSFGYYSNKDFLWHRSMCCFLSHPLQSPKGQRISLDVGSCYLNGPCEVYNGKKAPIKHLSIATLACLNVPEEEALPFDQNWEWELGLPHGYVWAAVLIGLGQTHWFLSTHPKEMFWAEFFGSSGWSVQMLAGFFYCRIMPAPVQKEESTIHHWFLHIFILSHVIHIYLQKQRTMFPKVQIQNKSCC